MARWEPQPGHSSPVSQWKGQGRKALLFSGSRKNRRARVAIASIQRSARGTPKSGMAPPQYSDAAAPANPAIMIPKIST